MAKFCVYCGTSLEEGAQCNCYGASQERAKRELDQQQPAVVQPASDIQPQAVPQVAPIPQTVQPASQSQPMPQPQMVQQAAPPQYASNPPIQPQMQPNMYQQQPPQMQYQNHGQPYAPQYAPPYAPPAPHVPSKFEVDIVSALKSFIRFFTDSIGVSKEFVDNASYIKSAIFIVFQAFIYAFVWLARSEFDGAGFYFGPLLISLGASVVLAALIMLFTNVFKNPISFEKSLAVVSISTIPLICGGVILFLLELFADWSDMNAFMGAIITTISTGLVAARYLLAYKAVSMSSENRANTDVYSVIISVFITSFIFYLIALLSFEVDLGYICGLF